MYRTCFCVLRHFFSVFPGPGSRVAYGTVGPITKLILVVCLTIQVSAQEPEEVARLRGRVVDARTGAPLPKVLVAIEGGPSVETGQDGAFSLGDVAPGPVRLYVSAVGYGLVQRTVQLAPGAVVDVRIPLSEGAATYIEELTVTADRFRQPESGVPAQRGPRERRAPEPPRRAGRRCLACGAGAAGGCDRR